MNMWNDTNLIGILIPWKKKYKNSTTNARPMILGSTYRRKKMSHMPKKMIRFLVIFMSISFYGCVHYINHTMRRKLLTSAFTWLRIYLQKLYFWNKFSLLKYRETFRYLTPLLLHWNFQTMYFNSEYHVAENRTYHEKSQLFWK